ncbi:MAG: helix-turn-helix domain-containing protein [Gammaproteobacteria bacterium]
MQMEWDGTGMADAVGLSAWRARVGAAFMRFEMEAPLRGRFIGRLAQHALGPLRLYDFSAPAHDVRRGPEIARRGSAATILAVMPIEGECLYTDTASCLTLAPGDLLFLSPRQCFAMQFPQAMRLRVVALPAPLLAHGPLVDTHCRGIVARAGVGSTAIGRSFLDGIFTHADRLSEGERGRMARLLLDMLETLSDVALASPAVPAIGTRAAQQARVLGYVHEHLADPDLDARTIAHALRMSPRYVRELLRASGTTLRALLLDQRLARCREELLDPLRRHRSVSDIAFAWGFNSAAHFTRVFRARYGAPPARFRRAQGAIPSQAMSFDA